MAELIVNTIIGCLVTSVFALVAYLLKRMIDQNDSFINESRTTFKNLGRKVDRNTTEITTLKQEVQKTGIDKATKDQIKSLTYSLQEIERELAVVKPTLVKAEESYGAVIRIESEMKAQEKKLLGLYQTIQKLIGTKTGR